jgi:endo-1,4-beta-xylanase
MKATLALALLPLIAASPTPDNYGKPKPKPAPGLGDLAKKAGLKYFGTAIDNVVLNNTKYTNIAFNRSEFNQVTPSNGQKWVHIEPQRNVFNYTLGDQVVDPSKEAGQMRRCHTFLWHSQLPDWVNNGNWTKTELLSILETHIKNEADYYWGDCYAWDVVNEAFLVRSPFSLHRSNPTLLILDIGRRHVPPFDLVHHPRPQLHRNHIPARAQIHVSRNQTVL